MLSLLFHIDIRFAIGCSVVASIATSSGSAAAYVREGITNIRLGMFLEIATTIGAVAGAFLALTVFKDKTYLIAIIFGCILIFSAIQSLRKKTEHMVDPAAAGPVSRYFKLSSTYPQGGRLTAYGVKNVIGGFFMMMVAGIFSGLLGIGSGALKVLAMDNIMRIPFKVSTTTSNFMIGVTAAASAVVYFHNGYIDPSLAFPVALGVLAGALTGARILTRAKTNGLRIIFSIVIFFLAVQMIYNGLHKNL
jgi:uncharacterized membrane protein YfcA